MKYARCRAGSQQTERCVDVEIRLKPLAGRFGPGETGTSSCLCCCRQYTGGELSSTTSGSHLAWLQTAGTGYITSQAAQRGAQETSDGL
ncbi:hypothetical protein MHYP_G00156800 [Metynnis hypsauchen]